jgi:preprotein translocase subunit SecE
VRVPTPCRTRRRSRSSSSTPARRPRTPAAAPPAPEFDGDDADLEEAVDATDGTEARRARQAPHEQRHHRNRLLSFLIAVWAELQRVEWPDRQTLTMLTGVVLLFVVVMGAYLGLLDAIFYKVIDKIL